MNLAQSHDGYIPAAGHHWRLPLYDPFTRLIGVDRLRAALLEHADLRDGSRVLDVGAGTGTLAVLIKRRYPRVEVVGLDPDPAALARAARKAVRAGAAVQFDRGSATGLPYDDGTFDRVVSTFMFHHLRGTEKAQMLREVHRVLAPDGRLVLADFAGPDAQVGFLRRRMHAHELLRDNAEYRVITLMREAGLDAQRVASRWLVVGQVNYYSAARVT